MPERGAAWSHRPWRVAIVGAGPLGTSVALRLAARVAGSGGRPVDLHVIEPHQPGAGLVWRVDQPPELLMNSPAGSARLLSASAPGGPAVPALADWLRDRSHPGGSDPACPGFATRAGVGEYLAGVFRRLSDDAPGLRVVVHRGRACRVHDVRSPQGSQRLEIENGPPLVVDAVVLTQGHLPVGPSPPEQVLAAQAERGGWCYLPPGPADVSQLSRLRPGSPVAVRGFGLTAVDLVALLTQGRAGRFVDRGGDRLRYLPSGAEPVLHIGSRTGLPYRAKPPIGGPAIEPDPADLLTDAAVRGRVPGSVDLRAELWPLIRRSVMIAYYRQVQSLGRWSPAVPLADLAAHLRPDTGAGAERLIRRAVPDHRFRFPADWWGAPAGRGRPVDIAATVRRDLAQPGRPDFPARLAARAAFIHATGTVAALDARGVFTDESVARDALGWFDSLSSSLTSGPPRGRLRQLLALLDAGVVRFVGSGMYAEPVGGGILVGGAALRSPVVVDALVDARLPAPDLCRTRDPLVRTLLREGGGSEVVVGAGTPHARHTGALAVDSTFHLLDRTDRPHPRRWAAGPSVRIAGADRRGRSTGPVGMADPADIIARGVLAGAVRDGDDVFASATGRAWGRV